MEVEEDSEEDPKKGPEEEAEDPKENLDTGGDPDKTDKESNLISASSKHL